MKWCWNKKHQKCTFVRYRDLYFLSTAMLLRLHFVG